MGLDTYIFKATKEKVHEKISEILTVKREGMKKAKEINGLLCLIGEDMNYMDKLNPEICWVKFNHITAWFSEKALGNAKGTIKIDMGVVSKNTLINLRQDCKRILEHCVTASGKLNINKKYCKKIFPYLNMPYFGRKDYDENFIEEIKCTIYDIDFLLLTSNNPDVEFIFYADY